MHGTVWLLLDITFLNNDWGEPTTTVVKIHPGFGVPGCVRITNRFRGSRGLYFGLIDEEPEDHNML